MPKTGGVSVRASKGRGTPQRGHAPKAEAGRPHQGTVALRIAREMGLLAGPKTLHFNAKVPPQLFEAAARRIGSSSPAAVVSAALAALATEDEVGPWLAAHWGTLFNLDPEVMKQIER